MKRGKNFASIAMRFLFRVLAILFMGSIFAFAEDPGDAVAAKLNRIVIPKIDFHDTTVEEAINFIASRALDLDPDPDPSRRGISILSKPPTRLSLTATNRSVTYVVESVSLTHALAEIARLANLDVHLTDVGIIICQPGDPPFPNGKAEKGTIWKTIHKVASRENAAHASNDYSGKEKAEVHWDKWGEAIGGTITRTKEKLGELDTADLMVAAKGLADALKTSDFTIAQGYAEKVDRHCGTKSVGACMRALIAQSQEGSDQAGEIIESFVRVSELTVREKDFFKTLPVELAKSRPADRIDIVTSIVYIACETKYGKGGGALPAVLGKGLKELMGQKGKPTTVPGGAPPSELGADDAVLKK